MREVRAQVTGKKEANATPMATTSTRTNLQRHVEAVSNVGAAGNDDRHVHSVAQQGGADGQRDQYNTFVHEAKDNRLQLAASRHRR